MVTPQEEERDDDRLRDEMKTFVITVVTAASTALVTEFARLFVDEFRKRSQEAKENERK